MFSSYAAKHYELISGCGALIAGVILIFVFAGKFYRNVISKAAVASARKEALNRLPPYSGRTDTSMSEIKEEDGRAMAAACGFSSDRHAAKRRQQHNLEIIEKVTTLIGKHSATGAEQDDFLRRREEVSKIIEKMQAVRVHKQYGQSDEIIAFPPDTQTEGESLIKESVLFAEKSGRYAAADSEKPVASPSQVRKNSARPSPTTDTAPPKRGRGRPKKSG